MNSNNKEIERRFLVNGDCPFADAEYMDIIQGYLCSDSDHVVRLRISGDKAFLTIKGPNDEDGFTHTEIEEEIPYDKGQHMLKLCEPGIIRKRRYLIPCTDGKHTFEVDVFGGKNEGLIIAEIELESEDDEFDRPAWMGKEITTDYRYSNCELRKNEIEADRKKIVYIDMDGVLVDFNSGVQRSEPYLQAKYRKNPDYIPGVFTLMDPMPGAVEAVKALSEKYDLYILSTASWYNPLCWMEKRQWVGRYFGETFHKKLILTHHKELNIGDYLIDDRDRNGASEFQGELIPFGSARFPDWQAVVDYLMEA